MYGADSLKRADIGKKESSKRRAEQSRGESKEETRKKKIYTPSVAVLTTLCQEEEAYAIKLN